MQVTVRRALTLARRYTLMFTVLRMLYSNALQENISAKIGLILSFSLIVVWGARKPVVSYTYSSTVCTVRRR